MGISSPSMGEVALRSLGEAGSEGVERRAPPPPPAGAGTTPPTRRRAG